MADSGKKPATPKAARALPLTHRQQRATKRPQSEQAAQTSAPSAQKRRTSATRRKQPLAPTTTAAPLAPGKPLEGLATLESSPVEAQSEATPMSESPAAAEATRPDISPADTTLRQEAPTSAPAAEAAEPATDDTPPRRVRVRVRRKRPSAAEAAPVEIAPVEIAPADITRVDTSILPKIRIMTSGETGPQIALADMLPLIAVDGAPVAAASAEVASGPTQDEPVADVAQANEEPVFSAALLAPEIEAPEASGPEVADAAAAQTDEEPERSAPARRMPTLAVMAALTQRAEPAAQPADEEGEAPPTRVAPPTLPMREAERLDVPVVDTGALDTTALDAPAQETPAAAPPAAESPAAESPAAESPAAESPKGGAPVASSSHRMWWPQAARSRAAPETRPISAASQPPAEEDLDTTSPRPVVRRPQRSQSMDEAQPTWSAAPAAAPKRMREPTPIEEDVALRRRRANIHQTRAKARHSTRMVVLSWAAFGHAALAVVAALVAVIAALHGPENADALAVFGWSVTLTLIAGVGATLGYICAQLGRPRLATLALLLSQLGALSWALGLLGPRAALLALAPASAALALRGAGRLSAVAAGLAWLILFIVDEALSLSGALAPTLALGEAGAALVDIALTLVGMWLAVSILISLYTSRMNAVAHGRAVEHVALLTEKQLHQLRIRTEDDANALRQALADALRGEQPERVHAHGALSAVGEAVNEMADRLIDLRYDRAERKRLESATRRLTRMIERAWLGLSWSWPEATGTILDDLLALLRTPPSPDAPDLFDDNAPTGQVVAPHLFRRWHPAESNHHAPRPQPAAPPGTPSVPSQPSAPTLPSLWPSDAGVRLTNPLELPPSPRWRSPDASYNAADETGTTEF